MEKLMSKKGQKTTEEGTKITPSMIIDFITWQQISGIISKNLAQKKKRAVKRFCQHLNNKEKKDILKVNVDLVIGRFASTAGRKLQDNTLKAYQSRVQKTLREFQDDRQERSNETAIENPSLFSTNSLRVDEFPIKILHSNIEIKIVNVPSNLTNTDAEFILTLSRAKLYQVIKRSLGGNLEKTEKTTFLSQNTKMLDKYLIRIPHSNKELKIANVPSNLTDTDAEDILEELKIYLTQVVKNAGKEPEIN